MVRYHVKIGLYILLCCVATSCQLSRSKVVSEEITLERAHAIHVVQQKMHPGDLLFRKGESVVSRLVDIGDTHSVYSHVGIVFHDTCGWLIVHAVPGETDYPGEEERLKVEPVQDYLAPNRAVSFSLQRLALTNLQIKTLKDKAIEYNIHPPLFDHDFDLDNDKLYCTEFIYKLYLAIGIDLTAGHITHLKLPAFNGDYILPSDLMRTHKLREIVHYNFKK